MKAISLKLPSELHARLDRTAKMRKQSKSEVVRAALEYFLNSSISRPGSLLEAVRPWIGYAVGPADFSTNSQHMEGFGQ